MCSGGATGETGDARDVFVSYLPQEVEGGQLGSKYIYRLGTQLGGQLSEPSS